QLLGHGDRGPNIGGIILKKREPEPASELELVRPACHPAAVSAIGDARFCLIASFHSFSRRPDESPRPSRRIRSSSGGCVANSHSHRLADTKNMWLAVLAAAPFIRLMVSSRRAMINASRKPVGSRVICTAEASARNSLCRLTAEVISKANNEPIWPMGQVTTPKIRASAIPNGCFPLPTPPFEPDGDGSPSLIR